jgi:hypothetical protein
MLREWIVVPETTVSSFRRLVRAPTGEFYIAGQETNSEELYRIDTDRLATIPLPKTVARRRTSSSTATDEPTSVLKEVVAPA